MLPIGVFGVLKTHVALAALVIRAPSRAMPFASCASNENPHRGGIDDHETVAAIGGIDGERAQPFDLQRDTQPGGETWQVLHEDALRLAIAAFGADLDQPPPGASRVSSVTGTVIGRMPPSSSTVDTQIEFEPNIGGVSSGSMMIKAASARGSLGVTSMFTWRKHPAPRLVQHKVVQGSSRAIQRLGPPNVSPGAGCMIRTKTIGYKKVGHCDRLYLPETFRLSVPPIW
jgi:hypothetical protein